LCHIRKRQPAQAPTPQTAPKPQPVAPKVERHPRFAEFKRVFNQARDEELDAFLKKNNGEKDDNKLYNQAITLFLD